MKNCKVLSHTADIRVRIKAKTIESLFKNAASCLFELLTSIKPSAKIIRKIQLEAQSLEELLVLWLNELISLFYSDKFLPVSCRVSIKKMPGKKEITAVVKGDNFNPYNNKNIECEIKAATYHNLKIKKDKKFFTAEVIFDV